MKVSIRFDTQAPYFWMGLFENSLSADYNAHSEIPVQIFHEEVEK